jgi:hypothetical protein
VPNLNLLGKRAGPDPVWHVAGVFSEGAGYSSVFTRPAYLDGVARITGSRACSVPDITMDAQDGTSEAAPLLNGVLALATQLNHGNLGPVNPLLYRVLGPRGAKAGIADVVHGNDSVTSGSKTLVAGFTAARGFDVASGWGTINAAVFVPSLVAATTAAHGDGAARRQAQAALTTLEHGIRLSAASIPAGGTSYLVAGGRGLPARAPGPDVDRRPRYHHDHRQQPGHGHLHDRSIPARAGCRAARGAAGQHADNDERGLQQPLTAGRRAWPWPAHRPAARHLHGMTPCDNCR